MNEHHMILSDNGHSLEVVHVRPHPEAGAISNDALRLLARWLVNRHFAENRQKSGNPEASGPQKVLDFPAPTSAHVT